jgi:hypothetical protein
MVKDLRTKIAKKKCINVGSHERHNFNMQKEVYCLFQKHQLKRKKEKDILLLNEL